MTLQPDNWGSIARIGMFIVSNEAVPEAEWWAMAPANVSIHAARITATTPWAQWNGDRSSVSLADDLERGVRQFANMRLEAVVIGHSSSSVLGGEGWDSMVVDQLSEFLDDDTVVTTNGLDCQAALRASNVSKPFLVFPPWFDYPFLDEGSAYFVAHGFSPVGAMRVDPGAKWRDFPPAELYPRGMGFDQDVESLFEQVVANCSDDADSVLLVGTGMRCVGIIQALEEKLRRPVISANQASLWHCLHLAGVHTPVAGYGNLLATT